MNHSHKAGREWSASNCIDLEIHNPYGVLFLDVFTARNTRVELIQALDTARYLCHTFCMSIPQIRRINARIDDELERKLSYLRGRTKQSTTAVVREAIERYHAAIGKADANCVDILERTGFIGCVDGPRDLSVRYKEELGLSLSKKL